MEPSGQRRAARGAAPWALVHGLLRRGLCQGAGVAWRAPRQFKLAGRRLVLRGRAASCVRVGQAPQRALLPGARQQAPQATGGREGALELELPRTLREARVVFAQPWLGEVDNPAGASGIKHAHGVVFGSVCRLSNGEHASGHG